MEYSYFNRGSELPGLASHDLAIQMFLDLAKGWKKMADYHNRQIWTLAKAFISDAIVHITGPLEANNTISASLLRDIVDPFFSEKEGIISHKLWEILRPIKEGLAASLKGDFCSTFSANFAQVMAHLRRESAQQDGGRQAAAFTLELMESYTEVCGSA